MNIYEKNKISNLIKIIIIIITSSIILFSLISLINQNRLNTSKKFAKQMAEQNIFLNTDYILKNTDKFAEQFINENFEKIQELNKVNQYWGITYQSTIKNITLTNIENDLYYYLIESNIKEMRNNKLYDEYSGYHSLIIKRTSNDWVVVNIDSFNTHESY